MDRNFFGFTFIEWPNGSYYQAFIPTLIENPKSFHKINPKPVPYPWNIPTTTQNLEWNSFEILALSANKGTLSFISTQFVTQDKIVEAHPFLRHCHQEPFNDSPMILHHLHYQSMNILKTLDLQWSKRPRTQHKHSFHEHLKKKTKY